MRWYSTTSDHSRRLAVRSALGVLAMLFASVLSAGDEFEIAPAPDWLAPVSVGKISEGLRGQASSGRYYLLADSQVRIDATNRTRYLRYATLALNAKGVESIANIEIEFDPAYQTLILHSIDVLRDGTRIAKLAADKVRVLQRETELEARIYDGSKTASVFLEDVRVGDTVDYAYSLIGRNPVFGESDFGGISLQYGVPVARIHARLLSPQAEPVTIAARNTELKPKVRLLDDYREYVWDVSDVPSLVVDDDAPSWYLPYPTVVWSEYRDWASVVQWARPLYQVPARLSPELDREAEKIAREHRGDKARLAAVLRLVQSEIRYLGVETGPGSHAPNPPSLVFERRFGDCKDKALLMISLLDRLAIRAHAALVNTDLRRAVTTMHPGPAVFDHVLVRAHADGEDYWLDPTRATQVGGLDRLYQSDYDYALVIAPESRALVSMKNPSHALNKQLIKFNYDASKGFEEPVSLSVETTVEGARAESRRYSLTSSSVDEIQNDYLNYYADYYPGIKVAAPLTVADDVVNNRVTTTEHYLIHDMAELAKARGRHVVSISSPDISDYLRSPSAPKRSAPLAVSHPVDVTAEIEVILPSAWKMEASTEKVEDAAFFFERIIAPKAERLLITDHFRSLTDEVASAAVPDYVANLARARQELGYELSWAVQTVAAVEASTGESEPAIDSTSSATALDRMNWPIALLGFVVLGGWIWLAVRVYRWDPRPRSMQIDPRLQGLRGWLWLPMLGVCLSPLNLLMQIYQTLDVFSSETWAAIAVYGGENYHAMWAPLLLASLFVNLGLLVASVLLALLFFQRRRSLPSLYIGFLITHLCVLVIDHFASIYLAPEQSDDATGLRDIIRALFSTVLWGTYFAVSVRVKSTFLVRYSANAEDAADSTKAPDANVPATALAEAGSPQLPPPLPPRNAPEY